MDTPEELLAKRLVIKTINKFYRKDSGLLSINNGLGICERALVFRLAHYLQMNIKDYFVDCDYDSATTPNGEELPLKPIVDSDGLTHSRFIDVIVHRRKERETIQNGFFCVEVKKWNSDDAEGHEKDLNNLEKLTSVYDYKIGFHIILGPSRKDVTWSVFKRDNVVEVEEDPIPPKI